MRVKSYCEDTYFYVRVNTEKEQADYGLRDDITLIGYQLGGYIPNTFVDLDFSFDQHAFIIKNGKMIRIDIVIDVNEHYVIHTIKCFTVNKSMLKLQIIL